MRDKRHLFCLSRKSWRHGCLFAGGVKIIEMNAIFNDWQEKFPHKQKPFLMAHRGNRALFPENTLAAFNQAVMDGADILETDLHLSKDGALVCIHDGTVERTMNGAGEVREKTLMELKSLRALGKDGLPTDETIPTLDELADFLPVDCVLALELKTDRFLEREVCLQMKEILERRQALDRALVLSFSLERLNAVRAAIPQMPIGWISMTRLIPKRSVDLMGSFWPAFFINPFYVKMAHRNDILTCPLDPAPDARLRYYLWMGVDAVLSDNPAKTRQELNRLSGARK